MERGGWVYILASRPDGALYVGVTSDLIGRMGQHREKLYHGSYTARYNVSQLVYHEGFGSIEEAITREKQLKGGSRAKKVALIEAMNPRWRDLYDDLLKVEEGSAGRCGPH